MSQFKNSPAYQPDTASELLNAALAYARRGWAIIPVTGKSAAGLWKPFQNSPADDRTLRRLFSREGITGLAVVLGRVSGGLAVRDFDQIDAYSRWAAENPDDAAGLPTVGTARGCHVYGRLDREMFITLPDGELRADSKHYVLVPPSVHPSGAVYSWTIPLPARDVPLPPLPLSLTGTKIQADPSQPIACITCTDIDTSAIIALTLPTGPGQRNRRLFDLARILKGLMPDATPDSLRAILREWHQQALPFVRTKDFATTWTDFTVAWRRVKRPHGCSLRAAIQAAKNTAPAIVDPLGYEGHLAELLSLCHELQRRWRDGPFPLSCATAGKCLGVSAMHAWRLLQVLQFDGALRLVRRGTKASKKASEWRFINLGKRKARR
jgi:hypothetical protein